MKARQRRVDILMGVYNGAPHLAEQLDSLAAQSHDDWHLICSDDGSGDDSAAVIAGFAARSGRAVEIRQGPRQGFSANYMSLLRNLKKAPGPVALADQDDVWLPDKLARALAALETVPPDTPALYCARRWLWDPTSDARRATPPAFRPPSFRNALIENVAPGNTLVLNPAGAALARRAAMRTGPIFAHDWWLYLLITGVGGRVIADSGSPCLLYRQHTGNIIGGGTGLTAQAGRKWQVLRGAFGTRLAGNLTAMLAVADLLTPENRRHAAAFDAARRAALPGRLAGLARIAPYRQSRLGTAGFWGAALLGRV